jgi:hypothetical protein
MRKLLVMAAVAMLVLGSATLAGATTPTPPRHAEGSFVAIGDPYSATFLFEVRASSTSRVEFGYYQTELMRAPAGVLPSRTQATVRTIRFFKTASGAPAAEFTGRECYLAAADSTLVGTCPWYHIIVTDGSPVGLPDTFCGAGDPSQCFSWTPTYGNIRIW